MRQVQINRINYQDRNAALFITQNDFILFDVSTSNSYSLTAIEAESLIKLHEMYPNDQTAFLKHSLPRLYELMQNKELFAEDKRKKRAIYEKKLQLQDVVVQIAYSCNFACTYCYADEGEYGGGKSYMMTEKIAKDLVDFTFKHRATNVIGYCLLGGEPLLNMKAVRALVLYAREKGRAECVETEFLLTTNGTPVSNSVMNFLKEHNISIRLSVDGTKEIHDFYRPTKKGKPTFDLVNDNFGKKMRESAMDYSVRATIFGSHGEHLKEQVKNLFEEYNYKEVKVDFIWGSPGTPGLITDNNIDSVYKGIDALGEWFQNKVLNGELQWYDLEPFSKYIGRIRTKTHVSPLLDTNNIVTNYVGGSILENNGVECGAGINVISISANGDIYSCHRTEGNKDYKMGSIYEGVSQAHLDFWGQQWRLEDERADCSKCWARYVCIGGCPAFGIDKHNEPMKCDRTKCNVRRQLIANSILLNHQMSIIEEKKEKSFDPPKKTSSCAQKCTNCSG